MGPHAAAIHKFVYYINLIVLFVFVLGSMAFEIRMFNAIKRRTYFVSLAPLLPSRTQVSRYLQINVFDEKNEIKLKNNAKMASKDF